MSRGVVFDFQSRTVSERVLRVCPPFRASGQLVVGSFNEPGFTGPIVAFMHDYYSVGAEEQRQMALNTVTLCEMLYTTQESNNVR